MWLELVMANAPDLCKAVHESTVRTAPRPRQDSWSLSISINNSTSLPLQSLQAPTPRTVASRNTY